MRDGISYIAKRHSKANNQYMENYDINKDSKSIFYWDANNLYGWTMNQPLPYTGFKFLSVKEIRTFDLNKASENSSVCYILQCDLEYPSELHDIHNDYPLAPEKLEIRSDILSKYCSEIANKYVINIGGVDKLVPNLRNKKKYIVHYRNLQLYLSLGMKLTKICRILKFKQSCWLKEYIEFNAEKRKEVQINSIKNFLSC